MSSVNYFLWDFNLKLNRIPLDRSHFKSSYDTHCKYEQRFFWQDHHKTITCHFFDPHITQSNYSVERNKDYYLMLPNKQNIKIRKDKMHYKPIVSHHGSTISFAPKKKYHLIKDYDEISQILSIDLSADYLEKRHRQKSKPYRKSILKLIPSIKVKKDRVIFEPFPFSDLNVEFSRLLIRKKTYYSCVVEASSLPLVEHIVDSLQIHQDPMSYITFLQSLNHNHEIS